MYVDDLYVIWQALFILGAGTQKWAGEKQENNLEEIKRDYNVWQVLTRRGKLENIGYRTSRASLDILVREGIFEEMMLKLRPEQERSSQVQSCGKGSNAP